MVVCTPHPLLVCRVAPSAAAIQHPPTVTTAQRRTEAFNLATLRLMIQRVLTSASSAATGVGELASRNAQVQYLNLAKPRDSAGVGKMTFKAKSMRAMVTPQPGPAVGLRRRLRLIRIIPQHSASTSQNQYQLAFRYDP
jgi:hypothetical protein